MGTSRWRSSQSRHFRHVCPVRHAPKAGFGEKSSLKFAPEGVCRISDLESYHYSVTNGFHQYTQQLATPVANAGVPV